MKKTLTQIIIGIVGLFAILFIVFQVLLFITKRHSPKETAEITQGDAKITVVYCRPYKKGRVIFGELVPFKKVWRTGANEATIFETSQDIQIDNQALKAGKYTLWTIPGEKEWVVIFNEKQYSWGVNFNLEATREAEADVIQVNVPVQKPDQETEQFTIAFSKGSEYAMNLTWDQTKVSVPISF